MSNFTAPGKTSEVLSEELSSQTVVAPTTTLGSARLLQFRGEGCEQDDDRPVIYFDWEDDNAAMFLERWQTRNTRVVELDPSFNRPTSIQHLYRLLLQEFCCDIDGASVIGNACIQCDSSIAYGFVVMRMVAFESQLWVRTIISGMLPISGKLANLFVTTTAHKSKHVKLECNLF